jgi:hypothetical protein
MRKIAFSNEVFQWWHRATSMWQQQPEVDGEVVVVGIPPL